VKTKSLDWYKTIWTLDIKSQLWVEDTENQVNFIINMLSLTGKERILDLACGFGRHSLSFARKGYSVVGVDITKDYIDDAVKSAEAASLNIDFIHSDIRDLQFDNEFDVVLNLADGAIGYLENDNENLKIFDVVAKALKPDGKHFMDICNADHAECYFPKRDWEIGTKALSMSEFDWNKENRRMLFGDYEIIFGEIAEKPEPVEADSIRLYSKDELEVILHQRQMIIINTFSNYYGREASREELQLLVYSIKKNK
jgi:2-polyprenyl-3-methyl-5-hydroxy-6-metoxy-1,4-benzoquinol methylase